MAEVIIRGNTYDVEKVEIPKASSGNAEFFETANDTATAADIAAGKTAHTAAGAVTGTYSVRLQDKTVNPTTSQQVIEADSNFDGLGEVTVNGIRLQDKTVNPTTAQQTVSADSSYDALGTVTIGNIKLQNKTVTPTSQSQTVNCDNSYDGLGTVTVNAAPAAAGHDYELISGDWLSYEGDYTNSSANVLQWGLPFECYLPNVGAIDAHAMRGSRNCENLYCARLENVGEYAFYNNPLLQRLDAGSLATISAHAFDSTYNFETLIIRKTDSACRLQNANAFESSAIARGTGFVYVPDALVDTYKAATNWVTYAAQIKPLSELPA